MKGQHTKDSLISIIDSLKMQNQIDKIAYKIDTQNSIALQVNTFYDSAWTKLIFVITILGLLVPIIIQYYQRRNFKDMLEGIKDNFNTKLSKLEENNELKITSLIDKHAQALIELDANTFFLQGRTQNLDKKYLESISSYTRSVLLLKKCNRYERVIPTLNSIGSALNKISDADFKRLDDFLKANSDGMLFEEILLELEKEIPLDSLIHEKIKALRKLVRDKNVA